MATIYPLIHLFSEHSRCDRSVLFIFCWCWKKVEQN